MHGQPLTASRCGFIAPATPCAGPLDVNSGGCSTARSRQIKSWLLHLYGIRLAASVQLPTTLQYPPSLHHSSSYGNFLIQTKRVSDAAFPEAIASSICRWCSSSEYPVTTKTQPPLLARSSFSIRRPIGRTTCSSTRPVGCLQPLQARLKVRNLNRLDVVRHEVRKLARLARR